MVLMLRPTVYDGNVAICTALAAAGVYTGPFVRTAFNPDIGDILNTVEPTTPFDPTFLTGYIVADVASAAGGVVLDYSENGATIAVTITFGALAAGTPFEVTGYRLLGKFFRIRVTNGAVAQATFQVRLYLIP